MTKTKTELLAHADMRYWLDRIKRAALREMQRRADARKQA